MPGPIVGNKWYKVLGSQDKRVKHTGEFRKPINGEYILLPDPNTGEWIGWFTCSNDINYNQQHPIAKLDTRFLHTLQIKVRVKSKFTPEDDGFMEELNAAVQRWIEKYEQENGYYRLSCSSC